MEHIEVKATAVATDLGQFTAIAAVFGNVDRDGDRIVKGAFADTIEAWQGTGRTVPLHWNHSAAPGDIVGHVIPGSMVETDQGLVVEGQLNLEDSERAREAWRAMKTGSIGLSFGYLTQKRRKAADGANELLTLDLFEISLTPAPANADTRVLGMKSTDPVTERREAVHRLMYDLVSRVPDAPSPKAAERRRKSAEPVKVATFQVD
jgi:uncharacterized protein